MTKLIEYIIAHTERGECQCGKCCDKQPDREPTTHSVDMQFFWVSAKDNPTAEELRELLVSEYPDMERLRVGPSYLEIGGALGDQGIALLLIALGELVGLWKAITPKVLGFTGLEANQMAGMGLLMASGIR